MISRWWSTLFNLSSCVSGLSGFDHFVVWIRYSGRCCINFTWILLWMILSSSPFSFCQNNCVQFHTFLGQNLFLFEICKEGGSAYDLWKHCSVHSLVWSLMWGEYIKQNVGRDGKSAWGNHWTQLMEDPSQRGVQLNQCQQEQHWHCLRYKRSEILWRGRERVTIIRLSTNIMESAARALWCLDFLKLWLK